MTEEPKRILLDELLAENKYTSKEISKKTGYSAQYVNKLKRKLKAENIPLPKLEQTQGTSDKIEKIEVPITKITDKAEKPLEIEEAIETHREELEGFLDAGDIGGFFSSMNDLLPNKYQRPPKAFDTIGKMGVKPLNRLLSKYGAENFDVMIFLGVLIIEFPLPVIVNVVKDRREISQRKALEKKGELTK